MAEQLTEARRLVTKLEQVLEDTALDALTDALFECAPPDLIDACHADDASFDAFTIAAHDCVLRALRTVAHRGAAMLRKAERELA